MTSRNIIFFCLCCIVLVLYVGCEKKKSDVIIAPDNPTPQVTGRHESKNADENNLYREEYDDSYNPGDGGFIPDITYYAKLIHFKEYLDSLYQRRTFSFNFQVPEKVKNEVVRFSSHEETALRGPGEGDRYAIITASDVIMYEKPSIDSPVVAQPRRGDIFQYDYTWDPREDQDSDTDNELRTLLFNEETFMYGDPIGVMVNDLYNNWHHITDNNISGWVFGAYLHLDTYPHVVLMQELYARDSKSELYPAYFFQGTDSTDMANQYHFNIVKQDFPPALQEQLAHYYIALEKVSPGDISVTNMDPDDMVYLYKKLSESSLNSVLITTDFIMHTLHLLFDRALQDIEMTYLLSYYRGLARLLFDDLVDYAQTGSEKLKGDYAALQGYMAVALSLSGQLNDRDREKVDPQILIHVDQEILLIEGAAGMKSSPLTGNLVDYSLFKPRGHYTLSESLSLYFKLMKWFGQIDFAIKAPDDPEALPQVRKALICTMLLAKSDALPLYEIYSSVLDYIVGPGDNPTPIEFFNIISEMEELNTIADLEADTVVQQFITIAMKKLPPSRISDMVMVQENMEKDPGEVYKNGDTIPGGFRLVSERFTIDGDIFTRLSSPRIGTRERPRLRVKTWDIAHVFGSSIAGKYLIDDMEILNYPQHLETLTGETSVMVYGEWYSTFYSAYLAGLRQLLLFPQDTGIPWLDSPLYQIKNHLTFFSAYAELKHDTILYTKQPVAAEMGGMPSYDYVRDQYPEGRGYIEPNLPFFYSLNLLAESMENSPAGEILLSSVMGSSFKTFFSECSQMRRIVEKEVSFTPLVQADYDFILALPRTIDSILLPNAFSSNYEIDADELRMAIVADIFTNATGREVLEVATGTPSRIYMAVYDPAGGRRICIGYTYTYYEFWQPMGNRLNDLQWRKAVYENDETDTGPIEEKIPGWLDSLYF